MSRRSPCPSPMGRSFGNVSQITAMDFTQANPHFSMMPPPSTLTGRRPAARMMRRPVAASSPVYPCSPASSVPRIRSPDMMNRTQSRYRDIPNVRAYEDPCLPPPTTSRRRAANRPCPDVSRAGANVRLAFSMLGQTMDTPPPPPQPRVRRQPRVPYVPIEDIENVGARPRRVHDPEEDCEVEESRPMMSRRQMLEMCDEATREWPVTPGTRIVPRSPRKKSAEKPPFQIFSECDRPRYAYRRALDFGTCWSDEECSPECTPEYIEDYCDPDETIVYGQCESEEEEDEFECTLPMPVCPQPRGQPLNFAIYQDEDDEC